MEQALDIVQSLLKPSAILLVFIVLLLINSAIFNRAKSNMENGNIIKNGIALLLLLIGMVIFILALPIEKSTKGQIITFLGIIISAGITLSSTTVLGNLIAGLMNNSIHRFRNGDLVKINDLHGRVIKKRIFHTEIQLEDSNFITIPNLYMVNNIVKLIRKTNAVISATVSLGYDVPREKIEKALLEAATATGLSSPYVYITELGDFSVVYKIHGFLEDTSKYFSVSSLLKAKVMDALHAEKIEIVSPNFMNQRQVGDTAFIPKKINTQSEEVSDNSPEDLIFNEAIASEKIENKKDFVKEIEKRIDELKSSLKGLKDETRDEAKAKIKRYEEMKERVEANIKEQMQKEAEE